MTITGPERRQVSPRQAEVDAALLLLERMGLSPSDLLAVPRAWGTRSAASIRRAG